MNYAALIFASLALPSSLLADATAYQALSLLAGQKGGAMLEQVYLVRGEGCPSQPGEWVIFRGEPDAVVFETTCVLADGRIRSGASSVGSEELPVHALPVNFSILNLDTDAAWKIAKRQARKEHFRFHQATYQLTTHPLARVPAWKMWLFNEERTMMGVITLSGATGEVLNPLKLYYFKAAVIDGAPGVVAVREPWGRRARRSMGRWFSCTGEAYGHDLFNAGGTTEEILVNRRTRHFSEDAR